MKPLIGINLDVKDGPPEHALVQANYYRAIQQAGGVSILIPPMSDADLDELMPRLSGVLFIGGDDYCPSNYGEEPHEKVERCHPNRDEFDVRLMRKALSTVTPILGICAGAQLLNIALGGSLIQDIPSLVKNAHEHTSKDPWTNGFNKHSVRLEPHTELANVYKSTDLQVVSSHHQAMQRLGNGLVAVAWAEDGIVEAIESKVRPFTIGVQWHPERDYTGNIPLFVEFVRRCAQGTPAEPARAKA